MADIVTVALIGSLNYAIFGFAGLIANVALLVALFRIRKENSTFNKTLASLAIANIISDMFFATIGTIFSYGISVKNLSLQVFLKMITLFRINKGFVTVALSHIVFIAIQRLLAVHFPLRFRQLFTTKVTWFLIVLIWLVSIIIFLLSWLIPIDGDEDRKVSYFMLIFGLTLVVCYLWMLNSLHNQCRLSKQLRNSNNAAFGTIRNWKLLLNSIGVTCIFLAFMCPYAISSIKGEDFTHRFLFSSFIAIRTLIDPLVYFFITLCDACLRSAGAQKKDRRISPDEMRGRNSSIISPSRPTIMKVTSI